MMRLQEKIKKEVIPQMIKKFNYPNVMAVPKIQKVVLNTGFGKLIKDKTGGEKTKIQEAISNDLALICGQRPVFTKAKNSIAGFKVRQGMIIGAMVTLRGKKMYDFLERLIHITLPRTRDFRGIEQKSIDKDGNLTIAIREHISFPEVSPEKVKFIFGFEITIVTSAKTQEQGLELLKSIGIPLKS